MFGREEKAEGEPVEDGAVYGIGYGAVTKDKVVQASFEFIGFDIRTEGGTIAANVLDI